MFNRLWPKKTPQSRGQSSANSFWISVTVLALFLFTLIILNMAFGVRTMQAQTLRFGKTSIYLANLFNGTGQGFTGGSQANGGVDDYNNGSAAPTNRFSKSWTACTSGADNYCGTGDSGSDAKDNTTGLVWSLPCNGSGCATLSDSSPLTYSWDSSGANNNSNTAYQLCSGHAGWSLPHQKQLMQAYIDGSYGNLEAAGVDRLYWSATTYSSGTSLAWLVYLSYGFTDSSQKTSTYYVRCVR